MLGLAGQYSFQGIHVRTDSVIRLQIGVTVGVVGAESSQRWLCCRRSIQVCK